MKKIGLRSVNITVSMNNVSSITDESDGKKTLKAWP